MNAESGPLDLNLAPAQRRANRTLGLILGGFVVLVVTISILSFFLRGPPRSQEADQQLQRRDAALGGQPASPDIPQEETP